MICCHVSGQYVEKVQHDRRGDLEIRLPDFRQSRDVGWRVLFNGALDTEDKRYVY